ncbi:MAG: DUF1598 domain-containing protein [Planctomycetota bacterium]
MRLLLLVAMAMILFNTRPANAGLGLGRQQAVGGVVVAPDGAVRPATQEEQQEMANLVRVAVGQANVAHEGKDRLRIVSLKRLQQSLREVHQTGGRLDGAHMFLAGMTRVQYVIVDEENQDLLLAGTAEPWKLLADGSVVGAGSGNSIVRLDDLVTAFRSVENVRRDGGIRVSIEPTAEGRVRLQNFLRRVQLRPGQNPAFLEAGMREAFGPQKIVLAGVPGESRFARTLVAADFEMKRLSMGLVDSPVPGLPSYLELARNQNHSADQNPRWWMACNYEPIARDPAGRVWKLSGQGVKTLTEQDVFAADGSVTRDGRQDAMAVTWAEKMTEKFNDLAKQKPIFQDLRNAMDLIVVATLVAEEGLDQVSGIDLSVLMGDESLIETPAFHLPKSIEPHCSFIRGRSGWIATASGGVNINPFAVAGTQREDATLGQLSVASDSLDRWWWDQ